MKHSLKAQFLLLVMLAGCASLFSCNDDDEESVNSEMELALTGDWYAGDFTFEYGVSATPATYEICTSEAEAFRAQYGDGIDVISRYFSLNSDKVAAVGQSCSEEDPTYHPWSVVKKSDGNYLKIEGNGTTYYYRIQSWSIDVMELSPDGYGFDGKFAVSFYRPM